MNLSTIILTIAITSSFWMINEAQGHQGNSFLNNLVTEIQQSVFN